MARYYKFLPLIAIPVVIIFIFLYVGNNTFDPVCEQMALNLLSFLEGVTEEMGMGELLGSAMFGMSELVEWQINWETQGCTEGKLSPDTRKKLEVWGEFFEGL